MDHMYSCGIVLLLLVALVQHGYAGPIEVTNIEHPIGEKQTTPELSLDVGDVGQTRKARHANHGPGLVPLYRYWNGRASDHFYTTNAAEIGIANPGHGYTYEGIQCRIYNFVYPGTTALYRYYNPHTGDHFYTTNGAEIGSGSPYRSEGITGYCFPQANCQQNGNTPLFRYWNPNSGDHFYTTHHTEIGPSSPYRFEGITCYVSQP